MAKQFNLNLSSRNEASSKTMLLQNMIEGDRPDYQYININNIACNEFNDYAADDSAESIQELANDIKRNGLLHNIVVSLTENGKYKLLSGERRLRAYRVLYEETKDAKYQNIYALIRKGLSELEEMIILDAANLQTRGGMSGEKRYRKASVRFVNNLKKQYNISEDEAIALTKQYAGVTDSVIEKNLAIEKELDPAILTLLDEGSLPKQQAYEYSRLHNDVQQTIGRKLSEARKAGEKEMRDINDVILQPAKNIRKLTDEYSRKKDDLKAIRKEAKRDENPRTAKILLLQEKSEKEKLKSIKKNINKEVKKIEDASISSSLFFSSSLSLLSSFSAALSSLIKNVPLSKLSPLEKEKIKKKLEKEKEMLDEYWAKNF